MVFLSPALLFFYLLFKVGLIHCIGRSLCKMTWAACTTYWTAFREISCFLWHKLKNTKRVYRNRFEEMEEGFGTSDDSDSDDYESVRVTRRQPVRERRNDHIRRSLHPARQSSKRMRRSGSHHHLRLRTRNVSVHVKGSGRRRSSRQVQLHRTAHHRGRSLSRRKTLQ